MRRSVFIVATLIGATCAVSSGAAAASGTPIANAPVLTSRASAYHVAQAKSGHIEFWKVRLSPGDYFSLNGTASPGSTDFDAKVFPAGTDGATLHGKSPLVHSRLSGVIGFTASRSGTYPIEFVCANSPTCPSFGFFVSITQEIELVLPNSADLKPSGTFTVSVRTPEGRAVTSRRLIINLYGLWKDNSRDAHPSRPWQRGRTQGQSVFQIHATRQPVRTDHFATGNGKRPGLQPRIEWIPPSEGDLTAYWPRASRVPFPSGT